MLRGGFVALLVMTASAMAAPAVAAEEPPRLKTATLIQTIEFGVTEDLWELNSRRGEKVIQALPQQVCGSQVCAAVFSTRFQLARFGLALSFGQLRTQLWDLWPTIISLLSSDARILLVSSYGVYDPIELASVVSIGSYVTITVREVHVRCSLGPGVTACGGFSVVVSGRPSAVVVAAVPAVMLPRHAQLSVALAPPRIASLPTVSARPEVSPVAGPPLPPEADEAMTVSPRGPK